MHLRQPLLGSLRLSCRHGHRYLGPREICSPTGGAYGSLYSAQRELGASGKGTRNRQKALLRTWCYPALSRTLIRFLIRAAGRCLYPLEFTALKMGTQMLCFKNWPGGHIILSKTMGTTFPFIQERLHRM